VLQLISEVINGITASQCFSMKVLVSTYVLTNCGNLWGNGRRTLERHHFINVLNEVVHETADEMEAASRKPISAKS